MGRKTKVQEASTRGGQGSDHVRPLHEVCQEDTGGFHQERDTFYSYLHEYSGSCA